MEADFDLAVDLSIFYRCDPYRFLNKDGDELARLLERLGERLEERKRVMEENRE